MIVKSTKDIEVGQDLKIERERGEVKVDLEEEKVQGDHPKESQEAETEDELTIEKKMRAGVQEETEIRMAGMIGISAKRRNKNKTEEKIAKRLKKMIQKKLK